METPSNTVNDVHGVYMGGSWLSWYKKYLSENADNAEKKSEENSDKKKDLTEENLEEEGKNTQVGIHYCSIS